MHTRMTIHPYATVTYRKTPRPPAVYSSDIRVVAGRCRTDGGKEDVIALLPDIFSSGISEKALTRKMTREEANKHYGGTSTQVYRMFLRGDEFGRSHFRFCAVGANEGGWRQARHVLRHLKRDHFGLGIKCPR